MTPADDRVEGEKRPMSISCAGVLAVLASAWLILAPSAYAQPGGTITGRVADETFAVTNETGDYGIDNVLPGSAELTFKLINFTIVRRMVKAGRISRFGNIDPSDGGRTYKDSLVADAQRSNANASTRATVFALVGLRLLK